MTSPSFKRVSEATDGGVARYGGQDIVKLVDVLTAAHPNERIQIDTIENREILTQFDYLIRGHYGQTGWSGPMVEIINLSTGKVEYSGSELFSIFQTFTGTLPGPVEQDNYPNITRIAILGTVPQVTRGVYFNRSMIIDGLGAGRLLATQPYTADSNRQMNLTGQNITIRNLTIESNVFDYTYFTHANPATPDDGLDAADRGIAREGIFCGGSTAPGRGIFLIENCLIKNVNEHPINFSRGRTSRMDDITIRNCVVDNMDIPGMNYYPYLWGGSINIGVNAGRVRILNNTFLKVAHSGLDLWGAKPYIEIVGNRWWKDKSCLGGGIAFATSGDSYAGENPDDWEGTQECIARDNLIYWDNSAGVNAASNDAMGGWAWSRRIILQNNFAINAPRSGLDVGSFDQFRGTNPQGLIYCKEFMTLYNFFDTPDAAGVNLEQDPDIENDCNMVIGNTITDTTHGPGIGANEGSKYPLIAFNMIYNVNTANDHSDGFGSAIRQKGSGAIKAENTNPGNNKTMFVYGNQIGQTNANMGRAFYELNAQNFDSTVYFNQARKTTDKSGIPMSSGGSGYLFQRNGGYRTENTGVSTAANAATITVTHGLAYTPSLKQIKISPTTDIGSATKFWVSGPTSTQFTINLSPAPAASVQFAWRIVNR